MSNASDFSEYLARELWAAFDYMSPIPPHELATFVVKQIDIAGYKLIKGIEDGTKE